MFDVVALLTVVESRIEIIIQLACVEILSLFVDYTNLFPVVCEVLAR